MTLPTPFQAEGLPFHAQNALMRTPLPAAFERFYRAELRRVAGARIRSSELAEAYQRFATDHGDDSASFRELGRWMKALGHRKLKSNGIYFADVSFASTVQGVDDNFRLMTAQESLGPVTTHQLVTALEQVEQQVATIRRALAGAV